jgi:hypothetical protein
MKSYSIPINRRIESLEQHFQTMRRLNFLGVYKLKYICREEFEEFTAFAHEVVPSILACFYYYQPKSTVMALKSGK